MVNHTNNERAVNLNWTWYLFLSANVLIIVGITITWGIYGNIADNTTAYIPIIVCNIIAMILVALFYFFDSKEMYLLHQHVPKKMFRLYFSSGFIFIFNLIFVFTMLPFVGRISEFFEANIKIKATFGIIFGVSAFISLITIAVYRYAKYKIDLTLYLRRRGKDDTTKTEQNLEKPTSSIVDHADQK